MKHILRKYKVTFLIITTIVLVCNVLNVLHPYILKQMIDLNFHSQDILQQITILVALYTIIHILRAVCMNLQNIKVNKIVVKILKELRQNLLEKVLTMPMKVFDKYNSSDIYTRLTADVNNMTTLFTEAIPVVINSILYIVFMIIMMLITDIQLGMIGTITLLIIAINSFYFINKIKHINDQILDKRDIENKEYSELYRKNKLTYLFGLQKHNVKGFNQLLDEELKYRKKYIFVESFGVPLTRLIEAIGIFIVLYYALIMKQSISIGSIYLVVSYIRECKKPLEDMFNQIQEMQICISSYQRIKKILTIKEKEEIKKGKDVGELQGDIELEQVCMNYGDKEVLTDVSFHIKKGQKVTIVGRTGVGKTTLTSILMRLYDFNKGNILIDGYPISNLSMECIRRNISYISQTPYIFKDTIRNNIILDDNNITDEQIITIIKQIGASDFIKKTEKGLDTQIFQSRLSSGELQIIAFIRAIIHKTNIYIFDEPTANIDFKTEKVIQNIINNIAKTSTVIIIAHRKSTLENSDKIIYLKNGKVDKIDNKIGAK